MTSGSAYFNAGLRLPVGSHIVNVIVYLNPNGNSRSVYVTRYRPLNPVFQILASATSTNGAAVEDVKLTVGREVKAKWNYRIDSLSLSAGGAILYGARIRYWPPA